jgi:hypothetical protein
MSTYTPIATFTVRSLTSVITFANIPQNYTDLVFTGFAKRDTGSALDMLVRFNGDSGSNYSRTYIYGDGTTAGSGRDTSTTGARLVYANSTNWSTPYIQIQNYASTYNFKTAIQRQILPGIVTAINCSTWRNTSAINTVEFVTTSDNWAIGTTFSLYGIEGGTPKAQGGNLVTTDGTYWYHTYTTSGTFQPYAALTADFLVIAGGGGGSVSNVGGLGMGGGGAGGYRTSVGTSGGGASAESALSLLPQSYTVTIGAGGVGGQENDTDGNASNGSNSTFATITSIGGGRGGNQNGPAALGGSGGGACGAAAGQSPGSGTANQGYAGGAGGASNVGGGGGGAGAVGQAGDAAGSGKAGAGGAGITSSISGTSVTRGGGGGGSANDQTPGAAGGAGGSGGGGAGTASNANGGAGTANTGGGGGASGNTATPATAGKGGNGGSGIVIVRYAV